MKDYKKFPTTLRCPDYKFSEIEKKDLEELRAKTDWTWPVFFKKALLLTLKHQEEL